jgi:p-hydroxybenzoate 3-monooxygenase
MRTQIAIIGAGPAGLMLAHLLHLRGIESIVLESRDRPYVESRVRAGLLEQGTVDLMTETGVGERMHAQGLLHHGIKLRFAGQTHRIDFLKTAGRAVMVYAQQEMVKDLIAARIGYGAPIYFEAEAHAIEGADTAHPKVRFRQEGKEHEIEADFVAGCDGFHGIARDSVALGKLTTYSHEYPFGWLGILAEAPPGSDELIYCNNERGFALLTMRSPTVSRLYLQVDPHDDIANWPDARIWDELHKRIAVPGDDPVNEGCIFQKGITPMRSFVTEPMRYGRLFLAGDAAHIVPPTGAKGLNLAVADVRVLALALEDFYKNGSEAGLDAYSTTCLKRVWRAQHFSWWMTTMLHRYDGDEFDNKRQIGELESVVNSVAGQTYLAENYSGLSF